MSSLVFSFCLSFGIFLTLGWIDVVEENKEVPPGNEKDLEECIPTRLTCVTLMRASITVTMAEFNLLHILLPAVLGQKVLHTRTHPQLCTHYYQLYLFIFCFFPLGFDCTVDHYTVPSSEATPCTSYAGRKGESGAFCTNVWPRAHPNCQQPQPTLRQPTASLLHTLLS